MLEDQAAKLLQLILSIIVTARVCQAARKRVWELCHHGSLLEIGLQSIYLMHTPNFFANNFPPFHFNFNFLSDE